MISVVNRPTGLMLACWGLLLAGTAHADTITLTLDSNFPSDYIFYSYISEGGSTESDPVAPYLTTLTDTDGLFNNTPVYAICYDINNDTSVGTPFTGHIVDDYGSTAVLEASYLANVLYLAGGRSAPLATQGEISLAIWQIMYPTSTDSNGHPFLPSDYDPGAQAFVEQAAAAVANNQWGPWEANFYPMWTPDDPSLQRFGIIFLDNPPVVVPEPRGVPLFGSALLVMALVWRRRSARWRTYMPGPKGTPDSSGCPADSGPGSRPGEPV